MQEQRNSSALAMELRLSCTNPLIYFIAMSRPANHTCDHIEKMLQTNAQDIKFDN